METKVGGIGGNLIWRMQKNVSFGGNLIWRMQEENVNFCGSLIWRVAKMFSFSFDVTTPDLPISLIFETYFPVTLISQITLGEEILAGRKFGGNKSWRNWREFNLADAKKC